ncbi:4-(cytidine 5'-diphospho)-2-C-methyl-D-erythritol kinase [bacterium]|nr:4-(cytidine 5'-diphospho)-2-C-methyl-D-erythritol kinase [bacterium]
MMKSPAKINLSLRILGRRADGFHELDTVFQEIDLCDEIEFYPAEEWCFRADGADLGPDQDNLVVRAARALSAYANVPCKARIFLRKTIPTGGGLGGGSSNASVTFHGLCRLWNLDIEWERLQELAAELGSDCPFFVYGGMARGRGRGEKLELYDGSLSGTVVAVFPGFGVNTRKAFSECEFDLTEHDKNVIFTAYLGEEEGTYILLEDCVNDLENIVLRVHPMLRELRDELSRLGADVSLLSGSGSTVFGVFRESSAARRAAQQLRERFTVYICRMVGRQRRAELR